MKRHVWLSLLMMTTSAAACADTFYVSTSGSDQNPGSVEKPLRTIQEAADTARAGDTILVRGGLYSEHVVLRFSGQDGRPCSECRFRRKAPATRRVCGHRRVGVRHGKERR